MSTVSNQPRHALGMPAGSVRALLALMVVGLVCALLLIPARGEPVEIPAYLLYLLFLVLGHYFAARGHARGQSDAWSQQPLHLPRGCIRLVLLFSLSAACIYRWTTDPHGFELLWRNSVSALDEAPMLPVVVLLAFFAGALLRMIVGQHTAPWFQDMEAWLSMIAVILMAIATMIHLVINPSLTENLHPTILEGTLSAVVAFYFGERS